MPLTLAVISTSRIVDEFLANAAAMPEISVQALCCRPQSRPQGRGMGRAVRHPGRLHR